METRYSWRSKEWSNWLIYPALPMSISTWDKTTWPVTLLPTTSLSMTSLSSLHSSLSMASMKSAAWKPRWPVLTQPGYPVLASMLAWPLVSMLLLRSHQTMTLWNCPSKPRVTPKARSLTSTMPLALTWENKVLSSLFLLTQSTLTVTLVLSLAVCSSLALLHLLILHSLARSS